MNDIDEYFGEYHFQGWRKQIYFGRANMTHQLIWQLYACINGIMIKKNKGIVLYRLVG